jgi:hypothetical protein
MGVERICLKTSWFQLLSSKGRNKINLQSAQPNYLRVERGKTFCSLMLGIFLYHQSTFQLLAFEYSEAF